MHEAQNILSKAASFLIRKRKPNTHKGDFGRILILAGSRGMSGACYLASFAALRSGAGLVTVGVPESIVSPLAKRFTEAMMLPLPETNAGTLSVRAFPKIEKFLKKVNVLAIGPGLSIQSETQRLVRKVVLAADKPLVIDADGLNAFKGRAHLLRKIKSSAIFTPHASEFVRLFGGARPTTKVERIHRAEEESKKFGVTIVLKGHQTVVAQKEKKSYVNKTGNPGMATAGSGDVLTGVISAFLAQGLEPFYAACLAVHVHGLVGDFAAKKVGKISLVASDLLDFLPAAIQASIS